MNLERTLNARELINQANESSLVDTVKTWEAKTFTVMGTNNIGSIKTGIQSKSKSCKRSGSSLFGKPPAMGTYCSKCGEPNHFYKCCKANMEQN